MNKPFEPKVNWLADRNELWLGSQLVKLFKSPTTQQKKILDAFQEVAWLESVPSPFRGSKSQKKTKLRNAIKALNAGHRITNQIRFCVDDEDENYVSYEMMATPVAKRSDSRKPFWDPLRAQLNFKGKVLKQYRWLAPNQAWVLAAFQEQGWPSQIDDPLPDSDTNPKVRIHDTIKYLNRGLTLKRIKFRGDGKGEGVLWEKC